MIKKEIRERIAQSNLSNWFNSVELNISFPFVDLLIELKGYTSIWDFYSKQSSGWKNLVHLPKEFQISANHFESSLIELERFIDKYEKSESESALLNSWNVLQKQIVRNLNYFTFDSPITSFLLGINEKSPEAFQGAYSYFTGQGRTSKQEFIGYVFAYEFESKGKLDLTTRIDSERKSIEELRGEFQRQINDSESHLSAHLNNSTNEYRKFIALLEKLKEDNGQLFNQWLEGSKNSFNIFDKESKTRLSELERTYEEKLKLEKPAKYWQKKSSAYYLQASRAKNLLFGIVGIACLLLAAILCVAPDYIFKTVFDGDRLVVIRWSVVFITLVSLIAFAVRALAKYMFSSYHLARDAEERHTLTFFYLSLLKDTEVKDDDRKLILQSLFSRTETGLLKEDSGPTMPSDWTTKISRNNI